MATIIKRFYTVVGNVTMDHVRLANTNGDRWVQIIDNAAKGQEAAVSKSYLLRLYFFETNYK